MSKYLFLDSWMSWKFAELQCRHWDSSGTRSPSAAAPRETIVRRRRPRHGGGAASARVRSRLGAGAGTSADVASPVVTTATGQCGLHSSSRHHFPIHVSWKYIYFYLLEQNILWLLFLSVKGSVQKFYCNAIFYFIKCIEIRPLCNQLSLLHTFQKLTKPDFYVWKHSNPT